MYNMGYKQAIITRPSENFQTSSILPFLKENRRKNVLSALWIWGAETFFKDGNGGERLFGPKNNGFPG